MYLVKGLSEIHDNHVRLPVARTHSSIQITNQVMIKLNLLGFARPLTSEPMLTVSKNVFKSQVFVYVTDYYML